ncbi:MAG: type III-B CRISPR-associated protein Cas10/Cmr2, partial [Chloroflexi bacterium]|nr:type III-B CRISPR-associated protein Cas10/Cmr2 [Chloroflexota bacterium]
ETLLAARKNGREFTQPLWEIIEGKPKSSLDGNRESVLPKKWVGNAELMYQNVRARPAEQLSGVDLLKRLGKLGEQDSFPSTSHMAAAPLRQRLTSANGKVKRAWETYFAKLPPNVRKHEALPSQFDEHPILGRADGSLLFESRLLDCFDKQTPSSVTNALQAFYKLVPQPIPYYALLVGDGDFMGKTIDHQKKIDEHKDFSQALAGFAEQAKEIVEGEAHGGAVVYAGGDDVMALLPVHTAVACTQELAAQFQEQMAAFTDEDGRSPTFSAGIAIVHHLEPLEDALEQARDAEKEAKSVDGKDALAISVAKRSGVPRQIKGQWDKLPGRLQKLISFYRKGELPQGLAYQLRDMYLHLGGYTAVSHDKALQEVIAAEAGRIIKRKDGSPIAAAFVQEKMIDQLNYAKKAAYTVESVANELIIAGMLAQAEKQSQKEDSNGTMDD